MYPRFKICGREKPDETSYTLLNSTELKRDFWPKSNVYYNVMSLDPATKNFAIRFERRWIDGRIETLIFEKHNFIQEDPVTVNLSFDRAADLLARHLKMACDCHYILSERQLPQNYKAVRMSQHVISLLMLATRDSILRPIIIEIAPQLKGKMLGAPKGIRDKELKKWAVEIGTELFIHRKDDYALSILKKNKKKDDLCDTALQAEALFQMLHDDIIGVGSKLTIDTSAATNKGITIRVIKKDEK
jgi:hypothetical protein